MKTFAALCLAVAAFASSGFAQLPVSGGPVGPGSVKLSNLAPSIQNTPEFQITGGSVKRSTLGKWLEIEVPFDTKPDMIDELTFQYVVGIAGKLLDGEVTVINVPKGRDHYSVMYIAPRTLLSLTNGQPLTGADIQNVWVTVLHQGQVLDRKAVKNVAIPSLPHLTGMVLNKNQTPFAPLYWDRYEALKPDTH
ncbi:MAG: hypothetical protein QM796_16520 [Chthoniobacteraceae bacterium]